MTLVSQDESAALLHQQKATAAPGIVKAALLGQAASLLLAAVGACSETLSRQGIFLPTSQSLLVYVCLAAACGAWLLLLAPAEQRQRFISRLPGSLRSSGVQQWQRWRRLGRFAALAAVDMEANFLLNKAYRYTSITSVTLLDCWTIPGVLLLTKLLLGARYRRLHCGGAAVCIAGLALLVLADGAGSQGSGYPHALWGDVLVLLGASLYAVGNVAQEYLLGDVSNIELLALLGFFGAILSAAQAGAIEHSALRAAPWDWQMMGPLLLYVAALLAFYSLVPSVLRLGGAAVLNLSLLSSDVWAAVARVVLFGGFSGASALIFFGSLGLVAAGISLFSCAGEVYAAPAPAAAAMPPQDAETASASSDNRARKSHEAHGSSKFCSIDLSDRGGELQRLWAGPETTSPDNSHG